MSRWNTDGSVPRGEGYDARFDALALQGKDVHGEVSFITRRLNERNLSPGRVLDAGCGTGRVALELARRGCSVVGVDLDPDMLRSAKRKAPDFPWVEADLASLGLDGELFDLAVLAGNVMIFVEPGTEAAVVERTAAHLRPGGLLVAGFTLSPSPNAYGVARYDEDCARAGLELDARYSTWEEDPWTGTGGYHVSVHVRV